MFSVSLKGYLLAIFFIFIPFSQALTIDVGFPLKISEIAMLSVIILSSAKITKIKRSDIIIILFLFMVSLSFLINILWEYPYSVTVTRYRFGDNLNSLTKLLYLSFTIYYFILLRNLFNEERYIYLNYFFIGAVLATLYGWYLMLSGVFMYQPLLLLGINNPQLISLQNWTLIRSGTFLEGNYMGLFLFISTVLATFYNRKFLAIFFTISMITTFSTMGILSLLFFYSYLVIKNNNIKYIIAILFLIIFSFASLNHNKDFNSYMVSKINIFNKNIDNSGDISKKERINFIITGVNILISNPILGVGISNYTKHYNRYNNDNTVLDNDIKIIPNNIYVEIASETGLIAFLLFIVFLYKIYSNIKNNVLRGGFLGCCLYFNALPSYTIIVIWFFFAFLLSKNYDNRNGE